MQLGSASLCVRRCCAVPELPTGAGLELQSGPERIVAGFVWALRVAGLAVPTGSVVLYAQALARVGIGSQGPVYWAGRATLVCRPEDHPVYDRVFAAYWQDRPVSFIVPAAAEPLVLAVDDHGDDGEPSGEDDRPECDVVAVRYSAMEILRHRDLATLTPAEWAEAQELVAALRVAGEVRPSRRRRPSHRSVGSRPDLRATVRRSLPTGGVPLRRAWRSRVDRPRRVVLVVDVSASMDSYARALVRFAHAAVGARRSGRVEVFALGTRLTRITRELARRDPDAALAAAAGAVSDWAGGTRLGAGLAEFNDRWGIRGMARGAVVVILSDGWDRGDPAVLGAEMARLSLVAHRVVWVNPHKASPGYAPLARGMAAALPYIDDFVEGHAVASLDRLVSIIAGGAGKGARQP